MKRWEAGRMLRAWGVGIGAFVFFLSQFYSVTNASIAPGATAGSFAVSPSGAATYTVPIVVPPGIAGMQPELAISYNSQSGTGTLGEGWSVSGLSSITRCPQTQAQDGYRGGVNLDGNDRYCLDGQRLINVSGTYGALGATYRTEIESFKQITSSNIAAGNGPDSFTVKSRDGKTYEYGVTTDSRITPGNGPNGSTVIVWALNKIIDIKGNYLTITYESYGLGEFHPKSINYTGNGSTTLNNSVQFTYAPRVSYSASVEQYYVGGSLLQNGNQLDAISTYVGAYSPSAPTTNRVKRYGFNYESLASGRIRLTSIQECAGDGVSCLNPILFGWNNGNGQITGSVPGTTLSVNPACTKCGPWLADINNDGKADMMWISNNGSGNYITWAYATSSGFSSAQTGAEFKQPIDWIQNLEWVQDFSIVDIDGDGKGDLVWFYDPLYGVNSLYEDYNGTLILVPLSYHPSRMFYSLSSTGFSTVTDPQVALSSNSYHTLTDINGDGVADSVWLNYPSGYISYAISGSGITNTTVAVTGVSTQVADINGDGKSDLIWLNSNGKIAYSLSTGSGFSAAQTTNVTVTSNVGGGLHMADINGDGKADAVWFNDPYSNNQIRIHYSLAMGTGFADSKNSAFSSLASIGGGPWTVDATGDGLADVVWLYKNINSYGTVSYVPNFACKAVYDYICSDNYVMGGYNVVVPTDSVTAGKVWPADIDGDGATDLVWLNNGVVGYVRSGSQRDKITSITSSLGVATYVQYKSLTDPTVVGAGPVYTRDSDAVYPIQDFQSPLYVVSVYNIDNGVGGFNNYRYQYAGAKTDTTGRGLLGFRQITVTDPQTNTVTTTTYKQDFPYVGMPATSVTTINGAEVSRVSNSYAAVSSDVSTQTVQLPVPYLSHSEQTIIDYDDRTFVTKTITDNAQVDQYGNIGQTTVTIKDGSNSTLATQASASTYLNDTAKWVLGLPTLVAVVRTEGNTQQSHVNGTIYRSTDRLPQTVLSEPTNYDPSTGAYTVGCNTIVETYDYDSYGNRSSSTVSGGSTNCTTASGAAIDTSIQPRTSSDTWSGLGTASPQLVSKNALNHQETKTLDPRYGVVTSLTGPNNLTTSWTYDSFGRKLTETRADGTTTTWTYCSTVVGVTNATKCSDATLVKPSNTVSYVIVEGSDGNRSVTYADLFGREIRSQNKGLDGSVILQDTQYNALGQVSQRSKPYYNNGTVYWSYYQYDGLGRVKQEDVPSPAGSNGSTRSNTYTTTVSNDSGTPGLLARQVKDANNNVTTTYTDRLGRTKKIKDANGIFLSFEHDVFGNPTKTIDPSNNVIQLGYDNRGRKLQMIDPDMGTWYYAYNALGELIWQQDSKWQVTTMVYDKLGRMTSRNEADLQSTWTYDTAVGKGVGKLHTANATNEFQRVYEYDDKARPKTHTTSVGIGQTYIVGTTYDAQGRVDVITYPTGFQVKHEYSTNNGALKRIYNPSTGANFWQATAQDALGHITNETLGAAINTSVTYDQASGALKNITTGTVQNQSYSYDNVGNLTNRTDATYSLSEDYGYDSLYRLKTISVGGTIIKSVNYDALGNITYRSDVGNYGGYGMVTQWVPIGVGNNLSIIIPVDKADTRGPGGTILRPHAPTRIGSSYFTYDANGNILSGAGRDYSYTSFNMPLLVRQGSNWSQFNYDADHNRVKQTDSAGKTTVYLLPGSNGVHYEKATQNGVTTHTHYLYGGGQMIGQYVTKSDGSPAVTRYFLRDQLGSIVRVVSDSGTLVECLSYDAWGKRRNCNGTDDTTNTLSGVNTNRGFTDHEHLDNLDLVHMNGRVYDPQLGRFLTPDPYIQSPGNLQNYNRYAYVDNNPLSATDPSGYKKFWRQKWFKTAVVAVAAAYTGGAAASAYLSSQAVVGMSIATNSVISATIQAGIVGGFSAGAVSGAYSGYQQTGNLAGALNGAVKSGATGAISGGVAAGIGDMHLGDFSAATAHGVSQGAIAYAQGGSFGAGFASGFAGSYASDYGLLGSMAAGGVSSRLAGGSFADGALTAGIVHSFNKCMHDGCWVTPEERRLANSGDWNGFYKTSCSNGDKYACSALKVATNSGFFEKISNANLAAYMIGNGVSVFNLSSEFEAIRRELPKGYVAHLDSLGATESTPKFPTRQGIGAFHDQVFSEHYATGAFGGYISDKWLSRSVYDYCSICQ